LPVEDLPQLPGNPQNDSLFQGPPLPDRAGIIASMAGIDDDHTGLARHLDLLPGLAFLLRGIRQDEIHDHPEGFVLERIQLENRGLNHAGKADFHAHRRVRPGGDGNSLQSGLLQNGRVGQMCGQRGFRQIDRDRLLALFNRVGNVLADVDHDPGMVRSHPVPDVQDLVQGQGA